MRLVFSPIEMQKGGGVFDDAKLYRQEQGRLIENGDFEVAFNMRC